MLLFDNYFPPFSGREEIWSKNQGINEGTEGPLDRKITTPLLSNIGHLFISLVAVECLWDEELVTGRFLYFDLIFSFFWCLKERKKEKRKEGKKEREKEWKEREKESRENEERAERTKREWKE